jgi:hypothetical protein
MKKLIKFLLGLVTETEKSNKVKPQAAKVILTFDNDPQGTKTETIVIDSVNDLYKNLPKIIVAAIAKKEVNTVDIIVSMKVLKTSTSTEVFVGDNAI